MSSDEESRNHLQRVASKIQVQDFQALVLPPVPVARGPNAHHQQQQQQQTHSHPHSHSHSPDISRRPVTSTSRGQHSSEPYPKPSNKGGVRGRVTVVCAEVRFLFNSFPFIFRLVLIISDILPQCKRLKVRLLLLILYLIFHMRIY
jgi:hypothetical protein